MAEKLIIDNFAGIKHIEVKVNKINIFIGPQASGKSVTAKLLFYFKSFLHGIVYEILEGRNQEEIKKNYLDNFISYFPKETWTSDFILTYQIDKIDLKISKSKDSSDIVFEYSESVNDIILRCFDIYQEAKKRTFTQGLENVFSQTISNYHNYLNKYNLNSSREQMFVPAGRSFFAILQSNIYAFFKSNNTLDPFIVNFGSRYSNWRHFVSAEQYKNSIFDKKTAKILKGKYFREKEKDFIIHSDGRKVNISNASSGQQETLPLLVILKSLTFMHSIGNGTTLYIEEPEAHLFPDAQKEIVELLNYLYNTSHNFQIVITTHSPYILSSYNNLMQAGVIKQKVKDIKQLKELHKILRPEFIVNPNDVNPYSLDNGKLKNLKDEDTQLIFTNELDSVSNELATEFDKLLDLEFDYGKKM